MHSFTGLGVGGRLVGAHPGGGGGNQRPRKDRGAGANNVAIIQIDKS